jgi:hypothetical protein
LWNDKWQVGEYPIAWRKKNLLHCHFVHCTFHVDFIRLSAKSFIIRLLRNSINSGKRFLSSNIYSCAAWVQATIYIQLHVSVYCNNASWAVYFAMEFFHAENFYTKGNFTRLRYENPNLKTYIYIYIWNIPGKFFRRQCM